MKWEIVNGVAASVSAVCAVISLGYMVTPHKLKVEHEGIISLEKFMYFMLATSGWALICICILWIFEPFGPFPTNREYKQFYGILLSFPAVIIFNVGYKYLVGNKTK